MKVICNRFKILSRLQRTAVRGSTTKRDVLHKQMGRKRDGKKCPRRGTSQFHRICRAVSTVSGYYTVVITIVSWTCSCQPKSAAQLRHYIVGFGWPVVLSTRSQVRPAGFNFRGDLSQRSGIGIITVWELTSPTVKPVKPAIAPCTAPCDKTKHS